MSQENVEVVRRGTALLNEGRWDELSDLWDREMEFSDLPRSDAQAAEALAAVRADKPLTAATA